MLAKTLNISAKTTLITLFAIASIFDIPILAGKGIPLRAPLYIGIILLIPFIAKLKKLEPYPHLADFFLAIPLLLDLGGNFLGLFDSFRFYDDIIHAVNWFFIVLAIHLLNAKNYTSKMQGFIFDVGAGTLLIVLWELGEWAVSADGLSIATNLKLSYADTIGDLAMSTLGGVLAALVGAKIPK